MGNRKIFLDTCVLSDIGRMMKKDREELSNKFNFEWNLQIIITPHNLIELERWNEIEYRENAYSFLDSCYLGYACDYAKVFNNEINGIKTDIIQFPLCSYKESMLNFKKFKDELVTFPPFISEIAKEDSILLNLQEDMNKLEKERGIVTDDEHINAQIINRYIKSGKFIDTNFKLKLNKIPSMYTYYYSYVKKIKSRNFRENYNEFGDVSMSYLAPFLDIIIAERTQVARYIELKQSKKFNGIDNVIIKRHSDVIKEIDGKFLFQMDI